ncbi:unnamed protein product, partial [Ceratitis capitata]
YPLYEQRLNSTSRSSFPSCYMVQKRERCLHPMVIDASVVKGRKEVFTTRAKQ